RSHVDFVRVRAPLAPLRAPKRRLRMTPTGIWRRSAVLQRSPRGRSYSQVVSRANADPEFPRLRRLRSERHEVCFLLSSRPTWRDRAPVRGAPLPIPGSLTGSFTLVSRRGQERLAAGCESCGCVARTRRDPSTSAASGRDDGMGFLSIENRWRGRPFPWIETVIFVPLPRPHIGRGRKPGEGAARMPWQTARRVLDARHFHQLFVMNLPTLIRRAARHLLPGGEGLCLSTVSIEARTRFCATIVWVAGLSRRCGAQRRMGKDLIPLLHTSPP